ncbi:hypothetical protein [Floccifex sp.]|uniref:hypothetical protein n=1 Tax=Floccifex sp. TaxID=2815810 RepID=UPI003EFF31E1
MIYAPVLITTLNRYECFKRCMISLQKNSFADKTEIFISVDYPLEKKYVEGYHKIKRYLEEGIEGFKNVYVFFQSENLGAIKNFEWIKEKVSKEYKYDRYIFLEDDNELAPCFLEFCDKGLFLFEQDESIYAINATDYVWCGNGYFPPIRKTEENNVEKRQLIFHASAYWVKKDENIKCFCRNVEEKEGFLKFSDLIKIYKKSHCFFYQYLAMVCFQKKRLPWYEGHLIPIDFMIDIYLILHDKFVISSIEPLQRDLGVDGNGVNYNTPFKNADSLKQRQLKSDSTFCFKNETIVEVNDNELKLHDKYMELSFIDRIKILIKCLLSYIKRKDN